jgi:hypothetical protein
MAKFSNNGLVLVQLAPGGTEGLNGNRSGTEDLGSHRQDRAGQESEPDPLLSQKRLRRASGVHIKSSQDLGRSEMNELKRGGECGAIAVVQLDVIGGGAVGIESDRVANYESNRFCFGLTNRFRRFDSTVRTMELFVCLCGAQHKHTYVVNTGMW